MFDLRKYILALKVDRDSAGEAKTSKSTENRAHQEQLGVSDHTTQQRDHGSTFKARTYLLISKCFTTPALKNIFGI